MIHWLPSVWAEAASLAKKDFVGELVLQAFGSVERRI